MSDFTVLLDMDSTVYDLLTPTLGYVKSFHGLDIKPSDIDVWRWDDKYKIKLNPFWNREGTYASLKTFPGTYDALKQVYELGIRQVFLSYGNFKYGTEKFDRVEKDFPFIGAKNVLLTGGAKDLAVGDVLFDDAPHNLEPFKGFKVLVDMHGAPYATYPQADAKMMDWKEYPGLVKHLKNKKEGWHGIGCN